jgi:hypothetical protein
MLEPVVSQPVSKEEPITPSSMYTKLFKIGDELLDTIAIDYQNNHVPQLLIWIRLGVNCNVIGR